MFILVDFSSVTDRYDNDMFDNIISEVGVEFAKTVPVESVKKK